MGLQKTKTNLQILQRKKRKTFNLRENALKKKGKIFFTKIRFSKFDIPKMSKSFFFFRN